jgi:uncharacterized membrane protein
VRNHRYHWEIKGMPVVFGCVGLLVLLFATCLMPLFLAEMMQSALERLHLAPSAALFCVLAIFFGGLINLPIYRFPRPVVVPVERIERIGPDGMTETFRELQPPEPVIAVNLGGCVIPVLLAGWQTVFLWQSGTVPLSILALVTGINIVICYLAARPVRGIGIMMPALLSPLVVVGLTWILLGGAENSLVRPGVAFIAGVFGPLVGADLLHLGDVRDPKRGGVLSIGGAGTFDGIVLSGLLAAFLA